MKVVLGQGVNPMRRREFIQLVACTAAGSLIVPQSSAGGASPMTIIDFQVHAYEANTPKHPGTVSQTDPITLRVTRWWRRWTRSASTARSSSRPFPCTATTRVMRWKCNGAIPVGSRSSSRSTQTTQPWAIHRRLEADTGRGRHPRHDDEGAKRAEATTGSCARP